MTGSTTSSMTEPRSLALPGQEESTLLAQQWRVLGARGDARRDPDEPRRLPLFHKQQGWSIGWSIVLSIVAIAAFRGFIDLVLRRFIPWPSLFGTDDPRLKEEDVVNRRRAWFWRFWWTAPPAVPDHRPARRDLRDRSYAAGRRRTRWATTQDVA